MEAVGRIHLNSNRHILFFRPWSQSFRIPNASFFSFALKETSEEEKPKSKKSKQSFTDRISAVIDKLHDRKLPPEIRGRPNVIKSETDLINIVERRIWRSMEEGQFENLPGKGKPLNPNSNPHADPAEDTLYRVLSKNGFAPEWVELNKEIRLQIAEWRKALRKLRTSRLTNGDMNWEENSARLQELLHDINNKVFRYNLIAPFGRQMFGFKWEKELQQIELPDS
ncbi:hypothetical protein SUGI_0805430 [Cryptomeria japonica]|uniref:uncharacterized protein LOC131031284 n=1 Tax=Cryptomeria japonica TaxID=3369 RepID=UPI0024147126|nr:uncharacterized protein LOC131031284 [Cryptomeria japonica]GLJ39433.1 hypothetical protein SUGI_0805430 [Cryptomeria japonica]